MTVRMWTALGLIVIVPGIVLLGAWILQRGLIYFPEKTVPPIDQVLPGGEPVSFNTEDGIELSGWWMPAAGDELAVVLVFNGNAGNRAGRTPLARRLAERGVSTLLFDYRGYGGNSGSPSEEGLYRDAAAARRYLDQHGSSRPLIYFGESLGSAVAVQLAIAHPPSALVLRSPFTSLVDVGKVHYWYLPVRWLLNDTYPTIDRIMGLAVPLLVVAGSEDEIVPLELSEEVFAAAVGDKRMIVIEGAGHNDIELGYGERLVDEMMRLVEDAAGMR